MLVVELCDFGGVEVAQGQRLGLDVEGRSRPQGQSRRADLGPVVADVAQADQDHRLREVPGTVGVAFPKLAQGARRAPDAGKPRRGGSRSRVDGHFPAVGARRPSPRDRADDSLPEPGRDDRVLGLHTLLAGRPGKERVAAALCRPRRYAGLEAGDVPLARQAEALVRARLGRAGLLAPWRETLLQELRNAPGLLAGLPLRLARGPTPARPQPGPSNAIW